VFAEMGFGKTACVLHALTQHFGSGEVTAALIVAPIHVTNLTWPEEIEYRHPPRLWTFEVTGRTAIGKEI
jgi:hypothetical protein